MSASLSVGQGSLLLNISAPLESDGVTLRDDVIGTKVWVSTLATFDPTNNEGTLVYEGNSLIVSIPGLTPGTTYYVKYAILSEIDPTVYTVSTTYSGIPRGEAQVVDISGYTNFVQSVAGTFTPANADIVGTTSNIINPQFTWAITGGTLSANTGQSVTVTPASGSSGIVLTLTVNGSNVITPISKTVRLSVVYDGQPGQTGSAGSKVAYPSIYKWTTDATPPTRPSAATPALKYTWATADVGTPTGWSSAAPSNDTPGSYLWQITIPLSAAGTVTESDLLWNSESYPIRAIGYNGANGAKGDKGATGDTGGPGAKGDTGSPGSASFVIDRGASATDTAPTAQEVLDTIGRAPVAGDMAIVSYSNNAGAKNYKYVTSWVLFNTYISGSLIVENTITGDRLVANTVTATKIDSRGLSIKDASGNIILSAGVPLDASNIAAAESWVNGNITVDADGKLQGVGTGAGTVVSNAKVTVDANGILQGTGTADVVVNNAKVNVDTDGKLQGIGTGAGTVVSNAKVTVDANGAIQGIGTGAGSTVNNASIGLILNANGTLTATGGPVASGGITAGGLGALSKSSADILSSTISINAVTGAGFRAGDLQWNAAGVRTSGKGVAMTPGGLLGVNADGVTTFAIDATTGEASFAGSTAVGQIATVATEVATNWKEKNITGIGSSYTWYDIAYTYYGTTRIAILIGKVTSGYDTYSTMFRSITPDGVLASWGIVTPPSILTWSTWINVTVSCAGNEFIIAGWEPVSGTTDYRLKVLKGVMASLNSVTWTQVVTLGGDTPYSNASIVWPKPVWIGSGKWIVQHVTGFYISTDNGSTWAGVTNTGSSTLTTKGPVAYNSATNTIAYTELFGTYFQSGTVGSGTTINWNPSVTTGSISGTFVGDCVWTGTRYLINEGKNLKYSSDGINWTTITISRSLRKIRPITSSIILGVSDSDGGLLRSSDGGLTWVDYSPSIGASAGVSLLGVVADSTNSIVVGNKGILFVDVSEQVPSGQGTVVDKAGKFYTGNSTSNIYFDGSTLNLQVPFLQSKNIINTDISTKEYYNAITAGPVNVYGSITVPTSSTLTIV